VKKLEYKMVFRQEENALIWEQGQEKITIEPWGSDSLRVQGMVNGQVKDEALSALLIPNYYTAEITITPQQASITNGTITAQLCPQGTVRFINNLTSEKILAEVWQKFPQPERRFKSVGGNLYRAQIKFKAYDGERFYGLGQHKHGKLDQKGCVIDLLQLNSKVCIPFLLSNRGYGFFWNNPAVGRVELGHNHTRWIAEATTQLDYWVTVAATPARIVENYVEATGHPPELPEWAAGFWQCKLRYETQEELLSVAHEYKSRGLPLSVIVIDYFHWTMQGEWKFDPIDWPDPTGMVHELEEMGIKVMVSVWPTVNGASENYEAMRRRGMLIETNRGMPSHWILTDANAPGLPAPVYFYDATNPEAREFFWDQIEAGYHQHGIKVFWLDACEPEMYPTDPENLRYHLGNGLAVTNIYPRMQAQAFYDGMKSTGEDEIVTLCRSAWAGSQKYGAAVWSGDIASTFDELQAQVRAGMNIGLSGIPWWTTDIGGFHGGDPKSPYFRELIVRWFQFGVFCPLFRLHGFRQPADLDQYWISGGPNEIWAFGDEAYEIISDLLHLREGLRPYIMEQMNAAHQKGTPPMRPLFYDFPEDVTSWDVEDQFMFGPDLLVAPILFEGTASRKVYLPAGNSWRNPWDGESFNGGQWIMATAPLHQIPLYLRGDAILPIVSPKR
jgi:alpha-D-xyloside xylohydrolase